jgi:hypothetical protein
MSEGQPQRAMSSDMELALSREASMAAMSLAVGLTHIRQYSSAETGFFYSGLFSIATGIERLIKLILIYGHWLSNDGAFLGNEQLRSCGHNISELIDRAVEIERRHGVSFCAAVLETSPISQTIVENLSDFAKKARYYNLDYLSGSQQSGLEPLQRWDREVCSEIISRHYKPRQDDVAAVKRMGEAMDAFGSIVWHTTERGERIDTAADLLLQGKMAEVKQRYSMYYLYVLVRELCALFAWLENKGSFYPPFLSEFFRIYTIPDKSAILRRKAWNPYAP